MIIILRFAFFPPEVVPCGRVSGGTLYRYVVSNVPIMGKSHSSFALFFNGEYCCSFSWVISTAGDAGDGSTMGKIFFTSHLAHTQAAKGGDTASRQDWPFLTLPGSLLLSSTTNDLVGCGASETLVPSNLFFGLLYNTDQVPGIPVC